MDGVRLRAWSVNVVWWELKWCCMWCVTRGKVEDWRACWCFTLTSCNVHSFPFQNSKFLHQGIHPMTGVQNLARSASTPHKPRAPFCKRRAGSPPVQSHGAGSNVPPRNSPFLIETSGKERKEWRLKTSATSAPGQRCRHAPPASGPSPARVPAKTRVANCTT